METNVTAKYSQMPLNKENVLVALQPVFTLLSLPDRLFHVSMSQDAHLVYVDDTHLESPRTYTAQGRVKVTATNTVRGRGRGRCVLLNKLFI